MNTGRVLRKARCIDAIGLGGLLCHALRHSPVTYDRRSGTDVSKFIHPNPLFYSGELHVWWHGVWFLMQCVQDATRTTTKQQNKLYEVEDPKTKNRARTDGSGRLCGHGADRVQSFRFCPI